MKCLSSYQIYAQDQGKIKIIHSHGFIGDIMATNGGKGQPCQTNVNCNKHACGR